MLFAAAAAKSLQSCPTVRPQRQQPTRLPRPWDSPGENTGVGCHFLLQCTKVKSESEVTQSCPTLSDPMDRSQSCSSIHGIFQARVLEWGAIAFSEQDSRGVNSFWLKDVICMVTWLICVTLPPTLYWFHLCGLLETQGTSE